MRFVTLVKLVVAACVAFAIALVAVVKTIDVKQYRLLVTDLLHAATGRTVQVRGDFQLELSLTPRIIATQVAMANPPGARRPDLLTVARVEAEIGLLALLRREVEVLNLTLLEPDLALEVDEAGRGNWHLRRPEATGPVRATAGTPATNLRLHAVTVVGGRVALRDRSARSIAVLSLNQLTVSAADSTTPIAFAAKGQFGKLPLDVSGTIGAFADLERGKPVPVRLQAEAGANQAVLDGTVADFSELGGLDLRLSLQGNDVAEAARLLGRDVPAIGPFRAALTLTGTWAVPSVPEIEAAIGRKELVRLTVKGAIDRPLERKGVQLVLSAESDAPAQLGKLLETDLPLKGAAKASARLSDAEDGWRLSDLKATMGRSDLAGEVALTRGEPRPVLSAALTSRQADLADFGFNPVHPPPKGKGEAVFRDDALLPLTQVTAIDLDVTWRAEKVTDRGAALCVNPGEATLLLRGGVLVLRPFTTAALGGMSESSPH